MVVTFLVYRELRIERCDEIERVFTRKTFWQQLILMEDFSTYVLVGKVQSTILECYVQFWMGLTLISHVHKMVRLFVVNNYYKTNMFKMMSN